MARTSSQKLEFWQFEVGLFNDMKMVDLNEKYGTLGEAVYFRILSYIADSEGYYAVLSDSLVLSIYRSIGSKWIKDKRVILRIIDYCGVCGLFDVNLLRQNVITSCGIQRRWLYAKEKARAKGFTTNKFWLLNSQGLDNCNENQNKCSNNLNNCDNNLNNCDNNLPYISEVNESEITPDPLQGGGCQNWKDRFFETFPVFERKNYKDDGVNYEVLYQEFKKSSTLQKMWSFPKVVKLYPQIANGDFRDRETEQQRIIQSINDKGEHERYYSSLRNKAQTIADKNLDKARLDPRFKNVEKELAVLEISLAKSELYNPSKFTALEEKKSNLLNEKISILSKLGLKEEDLKPKWQCVYCSDTGWLPNGKACNCYQKIKH